MVVLLAFPYDLTNPLPEIKEELKAVQNKLLHRHCYTIPIPMCGPVEIRDNFQQHQAEVAIFHFGGHALEGYLQLNDNLNTMRLTFVEALAKNICSYGGLKLVFLNGCSTASQAKAFLDQDVQAVISTLFPLRDVYALSFARLFYHEFCKNKYPLQQAFDRAIDNFLSDYQNEKKNWLDPDLDSAMRGGGFIVEDEAGKDTDIYRLAIHPGFPQAANALFETWLTGGAAPTRVTEVKEQSQIKSLGKRDEVYLQCNRRDQAKIFAEAARAKMEGQMAEPLFFFIHDHESNGPSELARRFQHFEVDEICKNLNVLVDIPLEEIEDDFEDEEKYRLTLSQLYADKFAGVLDPIKNRHILQKITPDQKLVMVKHDLSDLEWDDGWETFFNFYTGEYASILSNELSTRLVIVCTMDFQPQIPEPEFQQLFNRLANDLPSRVFSFSNLEEINPKHVNRWQKDVFGEVFFQTADIFTVDGVQLAALPFLAAKPKLIDKIRYFGSLKQSHG